jgi:hypothetical protein
MNALRTSRVVLIDDEPKEAMPMIQALGRLGIGCIHVTGVKEKDLPKKPYSGIRLAFVDMDLDVGGGNIRAVVAKTVNVFKHVVSEDSSPCLIVAWTKHADYVNEFVQALEKDMPRLVPCLLLCLDKPADASRLTVKKTLTAVRRFLDTNWPVSVLWAWEQAVHDAVTATASVVSEIAVNEVAAKPPTGTPVDKPKEWKASLQNALRVLAQASGGQAITKHSVAGCLLETLNTLHLDAIERGGKPFEGRNTHNLLSGNLPKLSPQSVIALNTRLRTAGPDTHDPRLHPGDVYVFPYARRKVQPIPGVAISPGAMVTDFPLRWTQVPDYVKARNKLEQLKRKDDGTKECKNAAKALKKMENDWAARCWCALVEVTPACDFAQKKSRMLRFVGGLLVPNDLAKVCVDAKRAPFLRYLDVLELGEPQGSWLMLLNAHFVFSCPLPPLSFKAKPAFRLRQGVVIDIQHWLSSHSSRPGVLAID